MKHQHGRHLPMRNTHLSSTDFTTAVSGPLNAYEWDSDH